MGRKKQLPKRRRNNQVTETIKLSISIELLSRRIATMEIQLQDGRGDYSEQDIEDYQLSAGFLNLHYGKNYNTKIQTL